MKHRCLYIRKIYIYPLSSKGIPGEYCLIEYLKEIFFFYLFVLDIKYKGLKRPQINHCIGHNRRLVNSGSLATRTNLRIPPIPFSCVCPFIIFLSGSGPFAYSGSYFVHLSLSLILSFPFRMKNPLHLSGFALFIACCHFPKVCSNFCFYCPESIFLLRHV